MAPPLWFRGAPRALVLAVAFLLFIAGCADAQAAASYQSACRAFGLCDEPPDPPVLFDILCDPSIGSSCNTETLRETTTESARYIARRPGSRLRFWVLGKTVGDTAVAGEQVVPPRSSRGSIRTHRAQDERFISAATDSLVAAAKPALEANPIRRSPLIEGITKVSMADNGGMQRLLLIVTDAREVSTVADFECGCLPTETRFLKKLSQSGLLRPGSLQGVRVEFVHVQSKNIPARGCSVQLDREFKVRALWTAALKAAGAADVRVSSGSPSLLREDNEPKNKEEGQ
jgi:hypothetical protein